MKSTESGESGVPSAWKEAALRARQDLLEARGPDGHWTGELSSSALSTATAVAALAALESHGPYSDPSREPLIEGGLDWLRRHQNPDGGWGDTILSRSNISTTTLVWSALGLRPVRGPGDTRVLEQAEAWLTRAAGALEPDTLARAIIARYGKDRTFSVPILTLAAICGRLGEGRAAWKRVIPLPFELAAMPREWFARLRLPVVSYALPALIAIGHARHHHAPSHWLGWLRRLARKRAFHVLEEIQPTNGGFLEATPLTSFVTLSLAASGLAGSKVAQLGESFLRASVREDGSWPIDTNLATWVTTLSIHAMEPNMGEMPDRDQQALVDWLLGQQYRERHPYTDAAPGGWAWTDLPGGVPDADDTSGALLALHRLVPKDPRALEAARLAIGWLLDLQNHDGGIPTFCRGWTKLPFDQSSCDITAHALRAWQVWAPSLGADWERRIQQATRKGLNFLLREQHEDGSWLPLWFGNQEEPEEANPLYGTTRVLLALAHTPTTDARVPQAIQSAVSWLVKAQDPSGGWGGFAGGTPSIEETSLALEALTSLPRISPAAQGAIQAGGDWLSARVLDGSWKQPSPIGFYFAKLWYFESLYPRIWATSALNRLCS